MLRATTRPQISVYYYKILKNIRDYFDIFEYFPVLTLSLFHSLTLKLKSIQAMQNEAVIQFNRHTYEIQYDPK